MASTENGKALIITSNFACVPSCSSLGLTDVPGQFPLLHCRESPVLLDMMARHLQRDVREDLVGPVPQPRLRLLVREDPESDVNVFHLLEGNPESQ